MTRLNTINDAYEELIYHMDAGPQLDSLVAQQIMGLDLKQICDGDMYDEDGDHWSCTHCGKTGTWNEEFEHTIVPKAYSQSIAAAWEVVDKMRKCPEPYYISIVTAYDGFDGFLVTITRYNILTAFATSAPLAICKAALRTITKEST